VAERRLDLAEIGARTFTVVEAGTCYRLDVPGCEVTIEIDRLLWSRQELSGEVLVRCRLLGTDAIDGVLSVSRLNLSSSRARAAHAAELARKARTPEIPWAPLLDELALRVLAAERSGEDARPLCDVPLTSEDARTIRVCGFLLPWRHPSVLFGDGGSCKSYLALYKAGLMAREGYRVALFDWELDEETHRERYGRLFGAEMPDTLYYARCSRALVYEADRLRRIVRTQGIDYGIFDSIGFGVHDAIESSDAALTYFRTVRQLGIGSLHLAHVSKAEQGDQKPFGSTFFFNSARACWNVKSSDDGAGSGTLTLGVFDRKPSLRARQQPFALEVAFTDTTTTIRHTEIADSAEFAPKLSFYQRLRATLKAGPMTRAQITAAFTDDKPETITRTIRRAVERGYLVQFPSADGVDRIGLAARRAS
jgi:hypothetical protein